MKKINLIVECYLCLHMPLKQEREGQNISLLRNAEKTKIAARYRQENNGIKEKTHKEPL